ncbi:MAG: hypothetical protein QW231_05650, partial [Candidatus Bathyarchaeia archaeon]
MFIGWGGRGQGLAGARDFIEKYYFNSRGFSTVGSKIKIAFSLEFSSDANTLAALAYGDYYHVGLSGRNSIPLFNWLNNQIFNIYLPSIQQKLNKIFSFENGLINRATPIISYSDSIFDTEIFTWAGGFGVGLVTVKSARNAFNSPIDTYSRVEWQNLAPQFQLSTCILYSLLNETVLNMPNPTPIRFMNDPRSMGIGVVGGRVVRYDLTSGEYKPVPNALVILTEGVQFGGIGVLGEQGVSGYASRPVLFLVTMADSEGKFQFPGVKGGSGGAYYKSYILYAYGLNSTTGMIELAMDMGEFGTKQFDNIVSMIRLTGIENVTLTVFRCGVMTAYGLISPEGFVGGITAPQILDATSHTPPQSWGYEYLGW